MPEVVGMAFLDLICCAFGGVILLYILADRDDGSRAPVENGMAVFIAELSGGVTHELGMRISGVNLDEACWGPAAECRGGVGIWDRRPGTLIAMVKADKPVDCVTVAMTMPFPRMSLPREVDVRLSSPSSGLDTPVKLLRDAGYRLRVPNKGGSC